MNSFKKKNFDFLGFRQSLGMSQERFAREIGVSAKTTWRWEHGLSQPSNLAMQKIDSLFDHQPISNSKKKW